MTELISQPEEVTVLPPGASAPAELLEAACAPRNRGHSEVKMACAGMPDSHSPSPLPTCRVFP